MDYLLNNGVKLPPIGFGVYKIDSDDETQKCVLCALENGYRHIDTAACYGNEKGVGHAVKSSNLKRSEIFITTKLWNDAQRQEKILDAFERSLENLQTDYIDLYLIHWPVKEKFLKTWEAFEKIYESKLVKAIGVSNFTIGHLEELKKISAIVPAVNQVELHPYFNQTDLLEYCLNNNIQLEGWSPLGAGRNDLLQNKLINDLAQKYNKTPAQIILRWNVERKVSVIPKSSNPQRIKENINIFDFALSMDEVESINKLDMGQRVGPDPDNFNF